MVARRSLMVAAAASAVVGQASAQQTATASTAERYALPGTEVFALDPRNGEAPYRIFVYKPPDEPPPSGFPVLYVLDANAVFGTFAEACRSMRMQPGERGIVVGIGYPTDEPFEIARRLFDLTPPSPTGATARPLMSTYRQGGQELLLAFIAQQLQPDIARRYPVDAGRQALFGHSLGGLFALHVLYTRPEMFHAIVAASPSQWWNDQAILAEERAFAARLASGAVARPARTLVVVGEMESADVMIADAASLAQRLKALSAWGLRSRFQVLDAESHMSVPFRSAAMTLRFALGRA